MAPGLRSSLPISVDLGRCPISRGTKCALQALSAPVGAMLTFERFCASPSTSSRSSVFHTGHQNSGVLCRSSKRDNKSFESQFSDAVRNAKKGDLSLQANMHASLLAATDSQA